MEKKIWKNMAQPWDTWKSVAWPKHCCKLMFSVYFGRVGSCALRNWRKWQNHILLEKYLRGLNTVLSVKYKTKQWTYSGSEYSISIKVFRFYVIIIYFFLTDFNNFILFYFSLIALKGEKTSHSYILEFDATTKRERIAMYCAVTFVRYYKSWL